jgi:hypothetical protein
MSFYWPKAGLKDHYGTSLQMSWLLRALVDKGLFAVTGTGNSGLTTMDGIPAIFAAQNAPTRHGTHIPELLVLGAVNAQGQLYPRTNTYLAYGLPHIYAPGWDVMTAHVVPDDPSTGLARRSGTSYGMSISGFLPKFVQVRSTNFSQLPRKPVH